MRQSAETVQKKVELEPGVIKQMIALYQSIEMAQRTYTSGSSMHRLQMDLVTASANAPNVKKAFQKAADAVGMKI